MGGREFVQCGHFSDKGDEGVFQMRTSALFDAQNFGFFEIYGVSVRTREVESVRTFRGQRERGQFFTILCGRPLWTASKNLFEYKYEQTKAIVTKGLYAYSVSIVN